MLHKKVMVLLGVLCAISCGRGQGQVAEEGPPGNIFDLSPKQIEGWFIYKTGLNSESEVLLIYFCL